MKFFLEFVRYDEFNDEFVANLLDCDKAVVVASVSANFKDADELIVRCNVDWPALDGLKITNRLHLLSLITPTFLVLIDDFISHSEIDQFYEIDLAI